MNSSSGSQVRSLLLFVLLWVWPRDNMCSLQLPYCVAVWLWNLNINWSSFYVQHLSFMVWCGVVCMCREGESTQHSICPCRSKGNLQESVLSFHHGFLGASTQAVKFGWGALLHIHSYCQPLHCILRAPFWTFSGKIKILYSSALDFLNTFLCWTNQRKGVAYSDWEG